MSRLLTPPAAALLLAASGCTFDGGGTPSGSPRDAGNLPDADMRPDADEPEPAPSHLLLSEIKSRQNGEEFVELWNPGAEPVELAGYYLADTASYAETPAAFSGSDGPEIGVADFVVALPADATLEPGEVAVVALDAAAFELAFDAAPAFAIDSEEETDATLLAAAFSGSVGDFPTLTDDGEGVALFYWDGETDLVTDVDLVHAGAEIAPANQLTAKTDLSVDGPDDGGQPSRYRRDAMTLGQFSTIPEPDQSYERTALEPGHETHGPTGNGLHGHDETSERLSATWTISPAATPGTLPTSLRLRR